MRHTEFIPPDVDPEWLNWAAEAASQREILLSTYRAALAANVADKFRADIDEKTYKGCARFLNDLFHKHCAYCETPIEPGQKYIDVEHYRPKLKVVDFRYDPGEVPMPYDTLLREFVDASGKEHKGYFWLAYDIDNLLPSCLACNRYEKKNFFPVGIAELQTASRLQFPQTSRQPEHRMLINPYFDDPNAHLAFDDPEGFVRPLSIEGAISINVYNLNREGLPTARRAAIRLAVADFNDWLSALKHFDEDIIREKEAELDRLLAGRRPYSTAARTHIGVIEERIARHLARRGTVYGKPWGIWPSTLVSRLSDP